MGIRISAVEARWRLEEAFDWANSDRPVPEDWTTFAQQTFEMRSKTYTPALGAVLLARATDDRVDPLSIKAEYGPNTYSIRSVGNLILVPAARDLGFSIRNTGREPMNNQPFFRYDHMSTIERVRDKPGHARFMLGIRAVSALDRDEALAALAAFLRLAIAAAQRAERYETAAGALSLRQVFAAVDSFLDEGLERPRRTQALAAAAFDVTHEDVRTRRLNDPSRDFPGDIQVFENNEPILATEVRAKSVTAAEVNGFVAACRQAKIDRAFLVVIFPSHKPLPFNLLRQTALDNYGVLLTVIETAEDMLFDIFGWSDRDLATCLRLFVDSALQRLREIEASDISLASWVRLTGTQ
jgi:hypothetical protein